MPFKLYRTSNSSPSSSAASSIKGCSTNTLNGEGLSLNNRLVIFVQLDKRSDKFSAREIMIFESPSIHKEGAESWNASPTPISSGGNSVVFVRALYADVTARISRARMQARATARVLARVASVS